MNDVCEIMRTERVCSVQEQRSEATSCEVCWSADQRDSATSWVETQPHHQHSRPTSSSSSSSLAAAAAATANHCTRGLFAGRHWTDRCTIRAAWLTFSRTSYLLCWRVLYRIIETHWTMNDLRQTPAMPASHKF